MLGAKDAVATLAVKDLQVARRFYEGTLGLALVSEEGEEALTFKAGGSKLIVYRSQYAGTNKATAVNWLVGSDIETIARGLRDRGVVFEHYDFPDMTLRGDLHVIGDMVVAWFKDPDGNIISLMNE